MSAVPGTAGLPLVSDKSYDFYKDPVKFQQKHMESTKSRVFQTRFLNKPTVFVCSNTILHKLLNDESDKLELGYKQFMEEIYGDNILFTDGDSATILRETLSHLFTADSLQSYQGTIDRIVNESFTNLDTKSPFCVYSFFKKLAVEICLSLFLGLDFSQSDASMISELTTTHWHGIISVPVAFKIPLLSESTYSKALHAKQQLLNIIDQRRDKKKYSFPQKMESLPDAKDVFINNHLLLFTSALVPKALSSILTSFAIEISKQEIMPDKLLTDESLLEAVLLEVLRLYPPFLGGRRIIKKEISVEGYRLPADYAVVYMTYGAQRDPAVFENPDEFIPERWLKSNKNDQDKLFCFGSGPRCCLGRQLVWAIIKSVIMKLLGNFKLTLIDHQDLTHKWLPVSRPKGDILIQLHAKTTESTNGTVEH